MLAFLKYDWKMERRRNTLFSCDDHWCLIRIIVNGGCAKNLFRKKKTWTMLFSWLKCYFRIAGNPHIFPMSERSFMLTALSHTAFFFLSYNLKNWFLIKGWFHINTSYFFFRGSTMAWVVFPQLMYFSTKFPHVSSWLNSSSKYSSWWSAQEGFHLAKCEQNLHEKTCQQMLTYGSISKFPCPLLDHFFTLKLYFPVW